MRFSLWFRQSCKEILRFARSIYTFKPQHSTHRSACQPSLCRARPVLLDSCNEHPLSRHRWGIEQPRYLPKTRIVLYRSRPLGRFNRLIEATNAHVVLASTWRLYEEMRCDVLAAGILFQSCTPDLPTQTRADEITAWLKDHPEIKRYAVLDDEPVPGHPLFRTSSRYGLTERICRAVVRHFNET